MHRRTVLKGALAASVLPSVAHAQGRDLTVVSWGGAYQDAQREVYFRPFQQQTRSRLLEETWDGGIGVLRSRIASGANTWDVVQVESEELLIGGDEGLFEKMDWDARSAAAPPISPRRSTISASAPSCIPSSWPMTAPA